MIHCSLPVCLPSQVTQQAPVEILVHLPMPAGRQETSKCAARCASPAQWDIHYMAQQRGSAFPMGRGRADNHSANVREIFKMSVWCYVWNSRRKVLRSQTEVTFAISNTHTHTNRQKLVLLLKEMHGYSRAVYVTWILLVYWLKYTYTSKYWKRSCAKSWNWRFSLIPSHVYLFFVDLFPTYSNANLQMDELYFIQKKFLCLSFGALHHTHQVYCSLFATENTKQPVKTVNWWADSVFSVISAWATYFLLGACSLKDMGVYWVSLWKGSQYFRISAHLKLCSFWFWVSFLICLL